MHTDYTPLLVNCERYTWIGNDPSGQNLPGAWRLIAAWTVDHNNHVERAALGKLCREAFERGERIVTWSHIE